MENYLWLVPLGFGVGALGTLIGVGGGFVLVPVLLLLYPETSPETITTISLAVVFFNALSGSYAYGRMGRVDYKSGLLFAAAAVPGAILGAMTTDYIPRRLFDGVFGAVMIAASVFLMLRRDAEKTAAQASSQNGFRRSVVQKDGTVHTFAYDLRIGMGLSAFVGYASSALGIGGGIIHVPMMVRLLNFPVHVATATSHFILAIMALTGTLVHVARGSFAHGAGETVPLAIGALVGAQAGAWLSQRVHGVWIIRGLAIALAFVGVRILILALKPYLAG